MPRFDWPECTSVPPLLESTLHAYSLQSAYTSASTYKGVSVVVSSDLDDVSIDALQKVRTRT
jgi:hypothetical protein